MRSARDRQLAAYAAAFGARDRSPRLVALGAALGSLAEAADDVADAVRRHDHDALVETNARSDRLVDQVGRCARELTDDDKARLDETGIPALCERLAAAARRNAYLIERAWALDAAQMRLLAGLGKLAAEGGLNQYAGPSSPAYVDRQA